MIVKETVVMVRENINILWPFEFITDDYVWQRSLTQNYEVSIDGLTHTAVRTYDSNVYIEERSNSNNFSRNLSYFEYAIENRIKITRTFEVI